MSVPSGGGMNRQRKKRRRDRGQMPARRGPAMAAQGDHSNRERIYQDVEGLLRRIREHDEENGGYSAQQMSDFTQAVVTLFKALESENEIVSERLYAEYQRLRERLSQALKSQGGDRVE